VTVVVKLGSSLVATPAGSVRRGLLRRRSAELAAVVRDGEPVAVVSSGAIALGLPYLGLDRRPRSVPKLQAASALGQARLQHAWEQALRREGVHAAQVLLTASDVADRGAYVNARNALNAVFAVPAVPVVNENDTTATDEITFGDNDFLSAQAAILLDARLLVLLTDTPGLHTADPRIDPDAELIEEVASFRELERYEIGARTSAFGSGGMRSKVAAAEMASAAGIPVVVCDGTAPGAFLAATRGEPVGTRFGAHPERTPSFKLWLRYAKPSRGRVVVDDGAARVLRERGSSLLPVGITGVEGDFAAGDAVEIVCDGEVVGKGIVNYSAAELGRIKGLKSAEVLARMPDAAEEAVHRNFFVLT
jgi:glutamate 5-kinase